MFLEKLKVLLPILTNITDQEAQPIHRPLPTTWSIISMHTGYLSTTCIHIHIYLHRCHYMLFQSKFFSSTELGRLPRVKTCANLMRLICYNNKDRFDTISHTYIHTYIHIFHTILHDYFTACKLVWSAEDGIRMKVGDYKIFFFYLACTTTATTTTTTTTTTTQTFTDYISSTKRHILPSEMHKFLYIYCTYIPTFLLVYIYIHKFI